MKKTKTTPKLSVALPTKLRWTFFTNHAHVLILLARDPTRRLRDIADEVLITERAVQKIIADLCEDGYLEITKEGRNNRYILNLNKPLRHEIERHKTIGDIVHTINSTDTFE